MKITEQIIIEYIDGNLNEDQAVFVREQLQTDSALMDSYKAYKEANSLLAALPLHSPSSAFSQNIMSSLSSQKVKKYEPVKLGNLFIIPLTVLAVTFFALIFQSDATASGSSLSAYLEQYIPNYSLDIPGLSTFKNYSYVLLIISAMLLIDSFYNRRKLVASLF